MRGLKVDSSLIAVNFGKSLEISRTQRTSCNSMDEDDP